MRERKIDTPLTINYSYHVCFYILAPPFVQSISPQTISESITRPIVLEFNISGDVPPVSLDNIRWTFNDIELMEDIGGRITFSENRLSLTITNLNLSDEGVYTLTATNPAGSSSASIFLDVQGNTHKFILI